MLGGTCSVRPPLRLTPCSIQGSARVFPTYQPPRPGCLCRPAWRRWPARSWRTPGDHKTALGRRCGTSAETAQQDCAFPFTSAVKQLHASTTCQVAIFGSPCGAHLAAHGLETPSCTIALTTHFFLDTASCPSVRLIVAAPCHCQSALPLQPTCTQHCRIAWYAAVGHCALCESQPLRALGSAPFPISSWRLHSVPAAAYHVACGTVSR